MVLENDDKVTGKKIHITEPIELFIKLNIQINSRLG